MANKRIAETGWKIFRTRDYDVFKVLQGNREVTKERTRAIKNSIINIGYRMAPILVNEKYEMKSALTRYGNDIQFSANTSDVALIKLNDLYNYNRKKKVYFIDAYRNLMRGEEQ